MLLVLLVLMLLAVILVLLMMVLLLMLLLSSGCPGIVRHDGLRIHKRIVLLLLLLVVTLIMMLLMMLWRRRLGPASPVRRVWWLSGEGQFAGVGARWVDRARSGRKAVLLLLLVLV